jgi:hypothetical protein
LQELQIKHRIVIRIHNPQSQRGSFKHHISPLQGQKPAIYDELRTGDVPHFI